MTEREFAGQICDMLNNYSKKHQYTFFEGKIILNAEVLSSASNDFTLIKVSDMQEHEYPYVVFATKLKNVDQDFIKNFSEFVKLKDKYFFTRMGVLLGDANCVPDILIDKAANLDFLFSFENEIPSKKEFEEFAEMIFEEIRDAIRLKKAFDDITASSYHKMQKRVSIDLK